MKRMFFVDCSELSLTARTQFETHEDACAAVRKTFPGVELEFIGGGDNFTLCCRNPSGASHVVARIYESEVRGSKLA